MEDRAHGIVLRLHPLTETSLIVTWLTKEAGIISTVAKGARRAKSSFQGKLDLLFQCEVSYVRSRRSSLHTLKEVKVISSHVHLREDIEKLAQACHAAALIQRASETESPIPELYLLMEGYLEAIASLPAQSLGILAFETRFLEAHGSLPSGDQLRIAPGTMKILEALRVFQWERLMQLRPTPDQTSQLTSLLGACIGNALEGLPKTRREAIRPVLTQ